MAADARVTAAPIVGVFVADGADARVTWAPIVATYIADGTDARVTSSSIVATYQADGGIARVTALPLVIVFNPQPSAAVRPGLRVPPPGWRRKRQRFQNPRRGRR